MGECMSSIGKNYPYSVLIHLLQLSTDATEYQRIVTKYQDKELRSLQLSLGLDYWAEIPDYLCTRCPLCGASRTETIDTYSLLGWSTVTELSKQIYIGWGNPRQTRESCSHLFTHHCFINLHGRIPLELWAFSNRTGEAPIVTPWFLPDDIPSYVVLHALPICRIEDAHFIPSYTLFVLSYYSENPELVWQRHLEAERQGGGEWSRSLAAPDQLPSASIYYDLQHWATQGKLGYLDFTQSELPLRIGPGTQLPALYRNIQGTHYSYMWRNGEFIANIHQGRRVLQQLIYPF